MLDFLRSEGIDEEMLARIEDFRRSFPATPENAGRIPAPNINITVARSGARR